MANNNATSNNKRKARKWTSFEEDRLIKNVEKHVLCLRKAFDITSKEIQRSPKAVAAHWYQRTSKKCNRTLFTFLSGCCMAVNRKNSNGKPIKLTLYKKVLAVLGLSY